MLNNIASTQIENIVINDSDRKKINLISNKSFRYCNLQSSIIFRHICIQFIFYNIALRSLHAGSLKITLTVPLNCLKSRVDWNRTSGCQREYDLTPQSDHQIGVVSNPVHILRVQSTTRIPAGAYTGTCSGRGGLNF